MKDFLGLVLVAGLVVAVILGIAKPWADTTANSAATATQTSISSATSNITTP